MTFPDTLILAGGRGERSRPYLGDIPKFLAPITPDGRTVADLLLAQLLEAGACRVIMGFGCDADPIIEYLKKRKNTDFMSGLADGISDLIFLLAVEEEPRGTVNAVRYATEPHAVSDPLLVLNGDTLLPGIDLEHLVAFFRSQHNPAMRAGASGVRLYSAAALSSLIASPARNIEDAEIRYLNYPINDDAFIDVGTQEGYDRARRHYASLA